MKNLYLIGGTMGVGKTTLGQYMKRELPCAVYLDGDWCWDADPFVVTEETKTMVMDNIAHLLNSFLACSEYENVIFTWVMHEQAIIDDILSRLNAERIKIHAISLTADKETLTQRLKKDIDSQIRKPDIIGRSVQRIGLYEKLNTVKIDTAGKTTKEIFFEITKGTV